jgi:hypothetical protein
MRRGAHAHVGRASELSGLRQVSSYREEESQTTKPSGARGLVLFLLLLT